MDAIDSIEDVTDTLGIAIIAAMNDGAWRIRLKAAIEGAGTNMRAVSLAAGLSPSYLHGVLEEGKDPTIGRLMRVIEVLPSTSLYYILTGTELGSDEEQFLLLIQKMPADERDAFLELIRRTARRLGAS